jgi:hypothetical protein
MVMYYPIVGWGLLVVVHYWFYVRNARDCASSRRRWSRPGWPELQAIHPFSCAIRVARIRVARLQITIGVI